jgi:DNA repair photolyase
MAKLISEIESLFPALPIIPILQPSPLPGLPRTTGPEKHPTLTGLARTAAEAPLDSTGCLTEYRPLTSRTIVNKVTSNRGLPFSHGINPYRGCEFACRYCYARYTHEFMEMQPEEFERKIYFKQNAAWLLEQDLRRLKPGTQIAIGTATDPYQPLERKLKITRSLLEVFARHSGFRVGIITKSALISRDIDLLKDVAKNNRLTVHITVTTMNAKLARQLEPRAPRPDLRMRTVAELRAAGLRAGVMCSPLMPGITDSASSIRAVARAASAAGASFLAAGALFLKPCSLPTFLGFVAEHFPAQLEAYKRRYAGSAFVSSAYRERMVALVDSICREFKLGKRHTYEDTAREESAQVIEIQPWLPFAPSQAPRSQSSQSQGRPMRAAS